MTKVGTLRFAHTHTSASSIKDEPTRVINGGTCGGSVVRTTFGSCTCVVRTTVGSRSFDSRSFDSCSFGSRGCIIWTLIGHVNWIANMVNAVAGLSGKDADIHSLHTLHVYVRVGGRHVRE